MSYFSGANDRPFYALKVVSALYGMDIAPDNVAEAIARLLTWLNTNVTSDEEFTEQARFYLEASILVGDYINSNTKEKDRLIIIKNKKARGKLLAITRY